jgi:glycosyltransferase involved in cell wall biosynthesis
MNIENTELNELNKPLLSIITICFNAEKSIEKTILSVIKQKKNNFEYIVIDGMSADNTNRIIEKYSGYIDSYLSSADLGIYDAMNRGIKLARGTWLLFLNAGDELADPDIISYLIDKYLINAKNSFYYSDVILVNEVGYKKLYTCDHKNYILNHQNSIYKKELHSIHGLYIVHPSIIISDYLFFSLIPKNNFEKLDRVISLYEVFGVSKSKKNIDQKFIVDFLTGRISKLNFIFYVIFYFYYLYFIRIFKIIKY